MAIDSPITWKTIIGPSIADASVPLARATQTMDSSFDRLNQVLQNQQTANQFQLDRGRDETLAKFKESLAAAATPEQLAALQQSGQLEALRGALDPTRRLQVAGAEEKRLGDIRQNVLAGYDFADKSLDHEQYNTKQQVLALAAQGKKDDALKLLASVPNMRGVGDLSKAITEGERDKFRFDHEQKKWIWDGEKHTADMAKMKDDLLTAASQRGLFGAQAEAARSNAATNRLEADIKGEQFKALKQSNFNAAQDAALRNTGNVYADGVYMPNQAPDLMEMMAKAGIGDDGGERRKIIERINQLREMPVTTTDANGKAVTTMVPLPLGVVKAAILGSTDENVNMWNQGWANRVEKALQAEMQKRQITTNGQSVSAVNPMVEDFRAYQQVQLNKRTNPGVSRK